MCQRTLKLKETLNSNAKLEVQICCHHIPEFSNKLNLIHKMNNVLCNIFFKRKNSNKFCSLGIILFGALKKAMR
jgi:hypothetical protein